MKHIAIKRPHFHPPSEAQRKWLFAALIAVVVLAGLFAAAWYMDVGLGEWGLFEE